MNPIPYTEILNEEDLLKIHKLNIDDMHLTSHQPFIDIEAIILRHPKLSYQDGPIDPKNSQLEETLPGDYLITVNQNLDNYERRYQLTLRYMEYMKPSANRNVLEKMATSLLLPATLIRGHIGQYLDHDFKVINGRLSYAEKDRMIDVLHHRLRVPKPLLSYRLVMLNILNIL